MRVNFITIFVLYSCAEVYILHCPKYWDKLRKMTCNLPSAWFPPGGLFNKSLGGKKAKSSWLFDRSWHWARVMIPELSPCPAVQLKGTRLSNLRVQGVFITLIVSDVLMTRQGPFLELTSLELSFAGQSSYNFVLTILCLKLSFGIIK